MQWLLSALLALPFFGVGCLAWAQAPGPEERLPGGADPLRESGQESAAEDTPDDLEETEPILPEPSLPALRKMVGGLASESFDIRERSQAALSKYARQHPHVLRDGLAEDYIEAADPEVRYRLAQVLYDAVVEDMEHSGFLGIIMVPSNVHIQGKVLSSIQVSKVLRQSAAARAGLTPGDQIIQVDDLRFDPGPVNRPQAFRLENSPNLLKFKNYIGGRKQGADVVLKIQRAVDGRLKEIEVPVRLGKRTRDLMEPEALQAEELFFEKWLQERAKSARSERTSAEDGKSRAEPE